MFLLECPESGDRNLVILLHPLEDAPQDRLDHARGADQRSAVPLGAAEAEQFGWGLERFRNEARTLVAFQHPNIVPVLRYFEAFGTGYLVMAFQDGRSLEDILAALGTLAEDEILAILRPLAAGEGLTVAIGFAKGVVDPPSAADARAEWLARNLSQLQPALVTDDHNVGLVPHLSRLPEVLAPSFPL